ncbi:hypothetical protein SC206_19885 [Rouxiella sp. T17]|uniref:hypothetical protein n=1 Tax=Rouxiella sp. T17 TaxID=3085684 RepID=UPI002FC75F5D
MKIKESPVLHISHDFRKNEQLHSLEERIAFEKSKKKKHIDKIDFLNLNCNEISKEENNSLDYKNSEQSHRNLKLSSKKTHIDIQKIFLDDNHTNIKPSVVHDLKKNKEKLKLKASLKNSTLDIKEVVKKETAIHLLITAAKRPENAYSTIMAQATDDRVLDKKLKNIDVDVLDKNPLQKMRIVNDLESNVMSLGKYNLSHDARLVTTEKSNPTNLDYIKTPKETGKNMPVFDVVKPTDNFPVIYNFQKLPMGSSVAINLAMKGHFTLTPSSEHVQRLLNHKRSSLSDSIKWSLIPRDSLFENETDEGFM